MQKKKDGFKKYRDFLDKLRDSGKVNMFESIPRIKREFKLSNEEAGYVLRLWMEEKSK